VSNPPKFTPVQQEHNQVRVENCVLSLSGKIVFTPRRLAIFLHFWFSRDTSLSFNLGLFVQFWWYICLALFDKEDIFLIGVSVPSRWNKQRLAFPWTFNRNVIVTLCKPLQNIQSQTFPFNGRQLVARSFWQWIQDWKRCCCDSFGSTRVFKSRCL